MIHNNNNYKHIRRLCIAPGNSLLELMIYLALFMSVFSLCYVWATHIYRPLMQQNKYITENTELSAGMTRIYSDFYMAPVLAMAWKKITEHELIWHVAWDREHTDTMSKFDSKQDKKAGYDIGYYFETDKHRLKRIEGTYDISAGRWHTSTTGLVVSGLDNCIFIVYQDNNRVSGVEIVCFIKNKVDRYADKKMSYRYYVALRNK